MKKIPTLFVRDENDRRYVTREVNPGCEWVIDGEGTATRKFDGTCVMFDGADWWARREVKPGKTAPEGFRPLGTDDTTGKTVGWEPAAQSAFWKYLSEAIEPHPDWRHGTYELVGPKVNGNPEKWDHHHVIEHGMNTLDAPRDFDALRTFLNERPGMEGIVWHHPDGRMVKLKRRDFPATSETSPT